MASMTDYLENALINHVLRNTPWTSPGGVYLALFTTATSDAGGGTEVAGGSYARQAVTWSAPSGGVTGNSGTLTFGPMPAVTVTHAAVFDASTGGNMLLHSPLAAPKTVGSGDSLSWSTGDITTTLL